MRAIALISIATLVVPGLARPAPVEDVQVDPRTGDYVVTYVDDNGAPQRAVYEPSTKLHPTIVSSFALSTDSTVQYRYRLGNASHSQQALGSVGLDPVSNLKTRKPIDRDRSTFDANDPDLLDKGRACHEAMATPSGWFPVCALSNRQQLGLSLGWIAREETGSEVPAGSELQGFGLRSRDLPGVVPAELAAMGRGWIDGDSPFCCNISADLDRKLTDLTTTGDSVRRAAAVPAIEVPEPYDGSVLIDRIIRHVETWNGRDWLAQDVQAHALTRLADARQAFAAGDAKSARKALQDARQALAHKYGDLERSTPDDERAPPATPDQAEAHLRRYERRLAARVLDFNIKYVQQRIAK